MKAGSAGASISGNDGLRLFVVARE